jgi:FMN phosphatase YigB (HAD superfamily)
MVPSEPMTVTSMSAAGWTLSGVVTFDFHNTLVHGRRWFELEVGELPAAFLRWQAEHNGHRVPSGSEDAARRAYRRLRQRIIDHGHELPAERCVAVVLAELGLPIDPPAIAEGVASLMRAARDDAEPVPGAVATVRALNEHGLTLAVVSSAVYHPFLEWALARFGMAESFRIVTTSASSGFYKSRPEVFEHTLRALGAVPARSVHVGDSFRYDVRTPRRIGMRTAWLSRDPVPAGEEPPDVVLPSLEGAAAAILDLSHAAHAGAPAFSATA